MRRPGVEGAGPGGLPPLLACCAGVEVDISQAELVGLVGWMWTFMRLDWIGLDGGNCPLGLDWMLT